MVFDQKLPTGHWVHLEARGDDTLPVGQAMHDACPPGEYVFATQAAQLTDPVVEVAVPAGHGQQLDCPPADWNWATGHFSHFPAPAVA